MSVIAGHTPPGSSDVVYMASVKGAPETLKPMVSREHRAALSFYSGLELLEILLSVCVLGYLKIVILMFVSQTPHHLRLSIHTLMPLTISVAKEEITGQFIHIIHLILETK